MGRRGGLDPVGLERRGSAQPTQRQQTWPSRRWSLQKRSGVCEESDHLGAAAAAVVEATVEAATAAAAAAAAGDSPDGIKDSTPSRRLTEGWQASESLTTAVPSELPPPPPLAGRPGPPYAAL